MANFISSWLRGKLAAQDDNDAGAAGAAVPSAPAPSGDSDGDVIDIVVPPPAHTHFEHYRKLIDSFDEDREAVIEKLVRYLLLLLAYLLPVVVAYAMGKEIGDAYGGPFNLNDGWSLGTHVVAMAGEFALTMMTFAAATALRKMAADGGYRAKFISAVVAFLLFSLASGLAQWFIASHHITTSTTAGLAALIFRVAMVPAVDTASLLFLAVMNFRSLKKFVADQHLRAGAIRDIHDAELEIQRAESAALRREAEERQDMQMKEQRNQVWLELDRMHAQHMIADARRRAIGSPSSAFDDALPDSAEDDPSERVKVRRINGRS